MYVEPGALHLSPQGTTSSHETTESPWVVAFVDGRPFWPLSPLIDLADEEETENLREYVEDLVPHGVTLPGSAAGGPPRQPAERS